MCAKRSPYRLPPHCQELDAERFCTTHLASQRLTICGSPRRPRSGPRTHGRAAIPLPTHRNRLRPYDLGSTQWYILYQLANSGPTVQRDLGQMLQVERATLSGLVATLVRKGLVDQSADETDQRQRVLHITQTGRKLWAQLPDPIARIQDVALAGADKDDLAAAICVLEVATARLVHYVSEGSSK
jgi:DNA-binding MarR family transcriptional regulator